MEKRRTFQESLGHWLTFGLGVKRWLLVLVLGAGILGTGLVYLLTTLPRPIYWFLLLGFLPRWARILATILVGGLLLALGVARLSHNLLRPFRRPGDSVAESLYHHTRRGKGAAIAAVGGGTGLPSLLRGLKEFTSNITAVVTVADDGGSSGRLREELGVLPPGDFRNNLAALARDEALMTKVLQYRFGAGAGTNGAGDLRGHAFGNLLLVALTGVTGSFDEALGAAERVLALRGRVFPSTLDQVSLVAEIVTVDEKGKKRGKRVVGESSIPLAGGQIEQIYLEPASARAYPPAVRAILQADLVVLGPGSLFTSIVPNLLVPGLAEAIRHSRATRVYICNLATQPGETDGYSLADHVAVIHRVLGGNYLDVVVANDNLELDPERRGKTELVLPTWPPIAGNTRLLTTDLVDEMRPWRHDSKKLADVLKRIVEGEAQ